MVAVMGAEGATKIIHRREIGAADDPSRARGRTTAEYEAALQQPVHGGRARLHRRRDRGRKDTRPMLIRALELFKTKHEDGKARCASTATSRSDVRSGGACES